MNRKPIAGLGIERSLHDFIIQEGLAGTGLSAHQFWSGLAQLVAEFTPRIEAARAQRIALKREIDAPVPQGDAIAAAVAAPLAPPPQIDAALLANMPQLLAPASSPRYLAHAVSQRWSSLYDALYTRDLIAEGAEPGAAYDISRGKAVIAEGRAFLDALAPLDTGSHAEASSYSFEAGSLVVVLADGTRTTLLRPEDFLGFQGRPTAPTAFLLRHKGLHFEIAIDRKSRAGQDDPAGIGDIILESALTAMVDFGDTFLAVDAPDRVGAYRNWLGLLKGSLRTQFKKKGKLIDRLLSADRRYTAPNGASFVLPGRALLQARLAGLHGRTDLVLDAANTPIPDLLLDLSVTCLIAIQDLKKPKPPRNSDMGSIYATVAKLDGPDEIALACDLLGRLETILRLPAGTIKLGLADCGTRTEHDLQASLAAAAVRLASLEVKASRLDTAAAQIEACGLEGRIQLVGDARADAQALAALLAPQRAADKATLRVPGTAAATLAALRVFLGSADRAAPLRSPAAAAPSAEDIKAALDPTCARVLGLLAHAVVQGEGSRRSPEGFGRIEDRADLRGALALLANWLHDNVLSQQQIEAALRHAAIGATVPLDNGPQPHLEEGLAALALALVTRAHADADDTGDDLIAAARQDAKAGQSTQSENRYSALMGATRGLEKGEHFNVAD